MSAPVDVLAVMDRHADNTDAGGASMNFGQHVEAGELRAARAAVAELIEAAERSNGDHTAPHDCYATGPLTGDPIRDFVACPGCELSAALARVKGGAA